MSFIFDDTDLVVVRRLVTSEGDQAMMDLAGGLTPQLESSFNGVATQPEDKIAAVARTWADHFRVKGPARERFILRYVTRCREWRFWCISAEIKGVVHAACRFEDVVYLFDGKRIHSRKLIPKKVRRNRMKYGEAFIDLPISNPDEFGPEKIIRKIKKACGEVIEPVNSFDSLTTYSKAFGELAYRAMHADVSISINEGPTRDMRYARPRRAYYMRMSAGVLKRFCSFLNPDALRAIRGIGCPTATVYNWITAGDVERRVQAIRAYPVILPIMVLSSHNNEFRHGISEIAEGRTFVESVGVAVDEGRSIVPQLALFYERSESFIKSAGRMSPRHVGSALTHIGSNGWINPLQVVLRGFELGNRRPIGKSEWSAWRVLFWRLPTDLGWMFGREQIVPFLAGLPAWSASEWTEICGRTADLRDLKLHKLRFDSAPVSKWTLKRLLNVSAEWHEVQARLSLELSKDDEANPDEGDRPWISMLPGALVHEPTGIEIVELLLPDELGLEGKAMSHCVSGYSGNCYSGHSRIVSFRKNGASLATAEFGLTKWLKKPTIHHLYLRQLKGYRNASIPASSEVGRAHAWLKKQIASRKVVINVEWPKVPYTSRPTRMRLREQLISTRMIEWLAVKMGAEVDDDWD